MGSNTATRLKEIMEKRNLKQSDILRMAKPYCERYKIKLGKSDLSQFVSGKVEPGQWKLTILGLALNVSEAWLMGLDVPMERKATPDFIEEDGRTNDFVKLFQQLQPEQQSLIIAQIKGILREQSNDSD